MGTTVAQLIKPLLAVVVLALLVTSARANYWNSGTATFYGGPDGNGTIMGGACGYGNLYTAGYGINNAALSQVLFNGGASCDQCYLIMCDVTKSPEWCKIGNAVTVTATNLCPPNNAYSGSNGGWCNPPRVHFDMSQPAWEQIGVVQAGIIPVLYRQVMCSRIGGVRFSIADFQFFLLVNIQSLGGSSSVGAAWVKGDKTGWIQMSMNWGAYWQSFPPFVGQGLSFAVTSTGGQYIQFWNVAPASWQFGQTFTTNQNFDY